MKYTVYKITNELDNKIYIGCHKTEDTNDSYMGSGIYLKRAQEKYGIENFTKEILKVFDNQEDMFNMESALVNEEFIQSKETYNLKLGGNGGFDYINSLPRTWDTKPEIWLAKGKEKQNWLHENDKIWLENKINAFKKSIKNYYDNGGKGSFCNKQHTDETREKIKNSLKEIEHQQGEKNSQFGTMWIYNIELKECKKIPKGNIPIGWLKGRKIKW